MPGTLLGTLRLVTGYSLNCPMALPILQMGTARQESSPRLPPVEFRTQASAITTHLLLPLLATPAQKPPVGQETREQALCMG